MGILSNIQAKAKSQKMRIVLAEGLDHRVVAGAVKAQQDGLAAITLLGPVKDIRQLTRKAGDRDDHITVVDPKLSLSAEIYAASYSQIYPQRMSDPAKSLAAMTQPLNFANMMVSCGHSDGAVAGASHSTTDVIRAANRIIGPHPDHAFLSSFFIMVLPESAQTETKSLIFADCACVVSPDAEQLAGIAIATAESSKLFCKAEPKIALLSFSTRGSARHPMVRKVEKAGAIVKSRRPDLALEAAIQFDAAISQSVGAQKAPGSDVAGQANILIFPNLDAGNIGYKMAERLGGAVAIGPIFQGLAKPVNDLSRGCDANAVYNIIAVTAVQAAAGAAS